MEDFEKGKTNETYNNKHFKEISDGIDKAR